MCIPKALEHCLPEETSKFAFKQAKQPKTIPLVVETPAQAERAIEAALSGKVLKGATPHIIRVPKPTAH